MSYVTISILVFVSFNLLMIVSALIVKGNLSRLPKFISYLFVPGIWFIKLIGTKRTLKTTDMKAEGKLWRIFLSKMLFNELKKSYMILSPFLVCGLLYLINKFSPSNDSYLFKYYQILFDLILIIGLISLIIFFIRTVAKAQKEFEKQN